MDKNELMLKVQEQLATKFEIDIASFSAKKNIIVQSDKDFFAVDTFGGNALIRTDKKLYDWAEDKFAEADPKRILDGSMLYEIEAKDD